METPLQAARRHVVQGGRIVARLECIVLELESRGYDTAIAEDLLDTSRALLDVMHEDLKRQEDQSA